jgi:hypothetical protein
MVTVINARHGLITLPKERNSVSLVRDAGRARQPVWTGAEDITTTEIGSQDRPARSK